VIQRRGGDDIVKLTDFGVAKLLDNTPAVSRATTGLVPSQLTPGYIAPEMRLLGTLDSRSDIFSLGVLVYEAACGSLPYPPDAPASALPRPRLLGDLLRDVPGQLDALLLRLDATQAIPVLAGFLDHSNFFVRWHIRRELLALDAAAALPHLEAMAACDPHAETRSCAARALDQLRALLTPQAIDPGHPFPYVSGLSLNLGVMLSPVREHGITQSLTGSPLPRFTRIKIPPMVPRLVPVGEGETCAEVTWACRPVRRTRWVFGRLRGRRDHESCSGNAKWCMDLKSSRTHLSRGLTVELSGARADV
jgi:serine/threonine protein kinase